MREFETNILRFRRGFSLVEILAVLAIITVIAAASGPAFSAFTRRGNVSGAAREFSAVMEGARQFAITRNTPVWMVVSAADPLQPASTLNIALVASRTGDDPVGWKGDVVDVSNHVELELVGNMHKLAGVKIGEPNHDPAAKGQTTGGNARPLEMVQWDILEGGKPRRFTHALKFTPTGQARVSTLSRAVEFVVLPLRGESPDRAVIRTATITGKISIVSLE